MKIANNTSSTMGKYVHNIRELSMSKRMSWIERMARAGKLTFNTESGEYYTSFHKYTDRDVVQEDLVEEYINTVRIIINFLDNAYGDRWDMHVEPINNYRFVDRIFDGRNGKKFYLCPIIHYPDIHIVSEDGNEHDIKDLFVGFHISLSMASYITRGDIRFTLDEVFGFRSTLSFAEWNSSYAHSHLSMGKRQRANSILNAHQFCTGSGDIAEFIPKLRERIGCQFDDESLGMLFSLAETMIRWESVSGNPYRRIRKINENISDYNAREVIPKDYLNLHVQQVFNSLKLQIENFPKFTVTYNSGNFYVNFTDEHINWLKDFIRENLDSSSDYLVRREGDKLIGYTENGSSGYIMSKLSEASKVDGETPYFFLSGKKIYLKIGQPQQLRDTNLSDFEIRKEFLNKLKHEFNTRIYKQQVIKSAQNAVAGV